MCSVAGAQPDGHPCTGPYVASQVRTLMELGDFLLGLEELPDLTKAMLEEIV